MSDIGCHHPFCDADADRIAYDTIVQVNIGFCQNHGRYWFRQDHIEAPDEVSEP